MRDGLDFVSRRGAFVGHWSATGRALPVWSRTFDGRRHGRRRSGEGLDLPDPDARLRGDVEGDLPGLSTAGPGDVPDGGCLDVVGAAGQLRARVLVDVTARRRRLGAELVPVRGPRAVAGDRDAVPEVPKDLAD